MLVLVLIFSLASTPAYSQSDSISSTYVWLHVGAGLTNVGFSGGYALNFQHSHNLFTVRYGGSVELAQGFAVAPIESMVEFAVLYSPLNYRTDNQSISASAGLGRTKGVRRGDFVETKDGLFGRTRYYEPIEYSVIGLAWDLQVHATFAIIGVGVYIFGNVNKEQALTGILACVQIGKMW